MMPIVREPEPDCLVQNSAKYTTRHLAKLSMSKSSKKPKPKFAWPSVGKTPINHLLLPILESMSKNHCSYCDGFPLGSLSRQTIDHFQPKETYPENAFQWTNLFLCCDRCQDDKRSRYHEDLLKPDDPDFRFEDYFLFNYDTGALEVNPFVDDRSKQRAVATIELLDLNDTKKPHPMLLEERRRVREDMDSNPGRHPDNRPYRFILPMLLS